MSQGILVALKVSRARNDEQYPASLDLQSGGVMIIYQENEIDLENTGLSILVEGMEVGVYRAESGYFHIHPDDLGDILAMVNG